MIQIKFLILLCTAVLVNGSNNRYRNMNEFPHQNHFNTAAIELRPMDTPHEPFGQRLNRMRTGEFENDKERKIVYLIAACLVCVYIPMIFTNWIMPGFLRPQTGVITATVFFWSRSKFFEFSHKELILLTTPVMFITNLALYSNPEYSLADYTDGEYPIGEMILNSQQIHKFRNVLITVPIGLEFFRCCLPKRSGDEENTGSSTGGMENIINLIIPAFLQSEFFVPMMVFGCLQEGNVVSKLLLLAFNIATLIIFGPQIDEHQLEVMGIITGVLMGLRILALCCRRN